MNTPNPLVPQGTFADKGKSHIRITVFAILAVHVVLLGLLLIAGCNKKPSADATQDTSMIPPVPPPPVDPLWPAPPTSAPPSSLAQQHTPPPADPTSPPANPLTQVANTITPPAPPDAAQAGVLAEHTIAKGESFYTLGKKYGVGYKAIVDANPGVNPNRLKIGDKVKIPAPKPVGATALNGNGGATTAGDGSKTYKVRSGDNLMKIAKTYGVTVKQLRTANNLRTDQIKVGQVLKIPPAAPAAAEAVPPVPAVPPLQPPPGFSAPPSAQ